MQTVVIRGARILVTGGTGSFGNQIVRRLVGMAPAEIRIFSRDEDKQYHMRNALADARTKLKFQLGDVRDGASVRLAMRGIDVVFHAAALKHVPSCERDVWQAVSTNVIGAENVIRAAVEEQVSVLIAISTDKAVEPINAMGMTKALQEKLITSAMYHSEVGRLRMACVRYGNVLGSRGSVVPHFYEQLRAGTPLTVTDREMTRFMLTLPEAVDLVLDAANTAQGGEIYVRRSPSTTVEMLARALLRLHGQPENFQVVGRRPGEKLHETLVSEVDSTRAFEKGDVVAILPELAEVSSFALSKSWTKSPNAPLTSANARRMGTVELESLLAKNGWGAPLNGASTARLA